MKLKFCGFRYREDIENALTCDIDYLGLIFARSKRQLDMNTARDLTEGMEFGKVKLVGVFMNQTIEEVVQTADHVGLDIIQLHGAEDRDYIEELRKRTDREIWKAIPCTIDKLKEFNDVDADLMLIDSSRGGGSGVTADWNIIKLYEESFNKPYLLAGGLRTDNIEEAMKKLKPHGLDISSGIERDGRKDMELMKNICRTVKNNG